MSVVVNHFTPDHEMTLVSRTQTVSLTGSRICGAWVGILPVLVARSRHRTNVLVRSLRSLSAAITGRMTLDCKLVADSRDLYCVALRSLHDELHYSTVHCPNVVLATSMCLALTEVLYELFITILDLILNLPATTSNETNISIVHSL